MEATFSEHSQAPKFILEYVYGNNVLIKPLALRKAKIAYSFGFSECNGVKYKHGPHRTDNSRVIPLNCNRKRYGRKWHIIRFVVVVALLFYVHGKHLRSCRDGQLT